MVKYNILAKYNYSKTILVSTEDPSTNVTLNN